jgi:hypothetical protein
MFEFVERLVPRLERETGATVTDWQMVGGQLTLTLRLPPVHGEQPDALSARRSTPIVRRKGGAERHHRPEGDGASDDVPV